ncbi:CshA/CshB family fibrillar adhesin-related protein [Parerythrobacter jejuensis]|uniref:Surface adhesin CshA non-repetitive domain-containing protein n=1 Tax=Parerythrobacter jejuensis TaxID=795812 RepID=A0A845AS18_9SPHN|nr:CshA/CshB family fibrillar adhesin-related protein [Parerythrobacter jejuensis]MXP30350.1 hypothetical protein [Parerythrobacter jejuensis]MXP33110.1 hypothetical protein [Parerythrobacter jejuensis]
MRWICALLSVFLAMVLASSPAHAAGCSAASSAGTAPPSWQTYCWLDLTDYNDVQARSASGQNFAFTLSDGSTLTFNLRTTSTAATGADARPAPSWSGAAVGNSAFLGIPGEPILYMLNSGSTVEFTFSSIAVTPPPGVSTITSYAFVVADGESTDNAEYLEYTTNGGSWELLDSVPPISGSQMPGFTGVGTGTFRETGDGLTGRVGAYIVGTDTPTTVTAEMDGAGLQGLMFAVRFASITLEKQIGGARVSAADQFTFEIQSSSSGAALASGTTTGTGLGPFDAVVLSTASGIPLTLTEQMAPGSVSALSQYQSLLTCVNGNASSSTALPTNVVTTNYAFGSLQFGDEVSCTFTNTPFPHVTYTKALGAGGRIFDTDQFRLRIRDRTTNTNLNQTTTTGTGSSFVIDSTGPVPVTAGNTIRVIEFAEGSTVLGDYAMSTVCTNANTSSTTTLGTGTRRVDMVLQIGDVVTCIVTNTRNSANARIVLTKSSTVISDGISASDPKAIPGAIIEYAISVRNEGDAPVDADTLAMLDIVPLDMAFDAGFGIVFTEGTTVSGLDPFDAVTMVDYSTAAGGTAPYDHTPSGFDSSVTGIRVLPTGTLAASDGTNHPGFTITYRMQVE